MNLAMLFEALLNKARSFAERERSLVHERTERESRMEERRRREKDDEEFAVIAVLIADSFRQDLERFSRDLDDAITAVRSAHAQAAAAELALQQQLCELQNNALVLSDGRRVFFTRDGRQLYGEDGIAILDPAQVAEAKGLQQVSREKSSFEDYASTRDALTKASYEATRLAETLDRLDDLDQRVKSGEVSPEDLKRLRQDLKEIVHTLPPETRALYDRMLEERERPVSYKAADSILNAPTLHADFQRAGSAVTENPSLQSSVDPPARALAYKAIPSLE